MTSIGRPLASMYVTQTFGERPEVYRKFGLDGHEGVDLRAAVGTPVYAAHDGYCFTTYGASYGHQVWVHGERFTTLYAHLSAVEVDSDTQVSAGDRLGLSGNSGNSEAPHLHFGLKVEGIHNAGYKDWIDPQPYMEEGSVGSKIGLHIQGSLPDAGEWYNATGNVGVLKQLDPDAYPFWGGASVAKVGRLYFAEEADKALIGRIGGGREYVRWCAPRWEKGSAHWWELWNEPPVSTREQRMALVRASLEALAAAPNKRFVVGNLSVGQPEGDLVQAVTDLLPLFQAAIQGGHKLGYHAYWVPEIGPENEWYARRWQLVNQVLSANGVTVPDNFWFLGEAGIDLGIRGGDWTGKGWTACVGREEYWRQLVAFDDICMADKTVWAWTPFTSAPNEQWVTFDFDATLRGWARERIRAIGWGGAAQPTVPPQPPTGGLQPGGDMLTAGDMEICRRFYATVPATKKAAESRGYAFDGEVWLPSGNVAAICTDPTIAKGRALELEVGTWRVLDNREL